MHTIAKWFVVLSVLLSAALILNVQATRDSLAENVSSSDDVVGSLSDGIKEPSCEQLRRMWHYNNKRRMQNRLPQQQYLPATLAEPSYGSVYPETRTFTYGTWKPAQPRPRSMYPMKTPVYGRLVHSPEEYIYQKPPMHRGYEGSFAQVARMVGATGPVYAAHIPPPLSPRPQTYFRLDYPVRRQLLPVRVSHAGKFRELQNALRLERAREIQEQQRTNNNNNNNKNNNREDEEESVIGRSTYDQYSRRPDDQARMYSSSQQQQQHQQQQALLNDDTSGMPISAGSSSTSGHEGTTRQNGYRQQHVQRKLMAHESEQQSSPTAVSAATDDTQNTQLSGLESEIPKGWVLGEW